MKIVRHIARDMRQAMRAIRERLGEDAVILSSRRVGDGVEVTAAIDFDATSLEAEQMQSSAAIAEAPPARSEVPTYRTHPEVAYDNPALIRRELQAALLETPPRSPDHVAPPPAAATVVAASPTPIAARVEPVNARTEQIRASTTAPPTEHIAASPTAPRTAQATASTTAPRIERVAASTAAPRIEQITASATAARSERVPASTIAPRVEHISAPAATPRAEQLTASATVAGTEPDQVAAVLSATAEVAPSSGADAVGAELKTLRRMLETQLAQLAWNDMTRRAPIHTEILREFTEIGISQELASHITDQLPQDVDLTYARRFAIAALSQYLLVTGDRWLDNGGRIAFIGATGVGKTTTLAKLAVRWVLRHGPRELALVAADGVRLGAQDQMQSLGQLLGVPVYSPENFETLPVLLSRLHQRFILIDTPGSSLRDTQLSSRMSVLASSASQLQTALVLAASTQAGALEEVVKRFAPANPCCCVLTKLDEAASLGGALSVLVRARIPVSYVSEGQRVPEDLRPARALELVSNAVRLAKATGAAADEDLLRRRFGKIAHALT